MGANITKVFSLGIVVAGGGGQINQIVSHTNNPGFETMLLNSDGQVDPRYAAIMRQSPLLSFVTTAITKALTAAGMSGLALSGTACDLWFQKYVQGGTRATGSNSMKYSVGYGMICPRTIDASDGAAASMTYEVWARTNDGATSPLAFTAASAMPAITAPDQLFTCGPVKINGTAMEGIQQITIDCGLQLRAIGGSGCAFPEYISIEQRLPKISIRSTHVDFPNESGMGLYVPQNATDSLVYLRKIMQNGDTTIRVPDATAEHISFSVDDGITTIRQISATQGSPAMIEALIEPAFDGTNAILAINTATAIS